MFLQVAMENLPLEILALVIPWIIMGGEAMAMPVGRLAARAAYNCYLSGNHMEVLGCSPLEISARAIVMFAWSSKAMLSAVQYFIAHDIRYHWLVFLIWKLVIAAWEPHWEATLQTPEGAYMIHISKGQGGKVFIVNGEVSSESTIFAFFTECRMKRVITLLRPNVSPWGGAEPVKVVRQLVCLWNMQQACL